MVVHVDVLGLIGDTPVVDVSVLSPNPGVRLVAKLESVNPAGSVKDRVAKAMVTRRLCSRLVRRVLTGRCVMLGFWRGGILIG